MSTNRAFIIGNGPSLNETPMDRLVGEVTFAVNRIHLLYPRTKGRPTHWVLADRSNSPRYIQDIVNHMEMGEDCWVRKDFYADMVKETGRDFADVHLYDNCTHIDAERNPSTGWHTPEFCCYGGSVLVAIQLAVRKGYNELYVLGCDLGYKGNEVNHFDSNYGDVDWRGVGAARLANKTLQLAHAVAYEECSKLGVVIRNAGVKGELLAYPRVKLETVLG